MTFSLEDSKQAVKHLDWLSDRKRSLLVREIYECARQYERTAGQPRSRPSQSRRPLISALNLAEKNPTQFRKNRLRDILRSLPESAHVYFGIDGEATLWEDFIARLEIEHPDCEDRIAFAEITDLVGKALSSVPTDNGGQNSRDIITLRLMFCLRYRYEAAAKLPAKHGATNPFTELCFYVGNQVDPGLSESKIEDYIKEVLAYGDPIARV